MSPELSAFKKDFEDYTNIRVYDTIEERDYFHWKRLVLGRINCDQMIIVGNYIKYRFYEEGNFSHLLPQLQSYNDYLVLTVETNEIKKFILKLF